LRANEEANVTTTAELGIHESIRRGHIPVLRIEGRLDAVNAQLLCERCARIEDESRVLILNLSGITFLSSSGVGALLVIDERFRNRGGIVRLTELSNPVLTTLGLLDLRPELTIDPTEDDAVKAAEE
jgi:anti-anti-sigma factor